MTTDASATGKGRWLFIVLGVLLALVGLGLALGGIYLVTLGGSFYYVIAGALLAASGVGVARRKSFALWTFAMAFVGTVIWAYAEIGTQFWGWVPRILPFFVMAVIMALLAPGVSRARKAPAFAVAAVFAVVTVVTFAQMFQPHGVIQPAVASRSDDAAITAETADADWTFFGGTGAGTRHSASAEITPENVSQLEVAWQIRTGDMTGGASEFQNTPQQIGDTLYVCTPRNIVMALDVDTGEEKWRFDPEITKQGFLRCRGVGYFDADSIEDVTPRVGAELASTPAIAPAEDAEDGTDLADAQDEAPAPAAPVSPLDTDVCRQRIITTTIEAQLHAVDAETGEFCADFNGGEPVDLRLNVGAAEPNPNYYGQTSAPTVAGDVVIIGSFVSDGRAQDMPGGVIRGYSALTGELLWAFDPETPDDTTPPADGEDYARNTPNMWSTAVIDTDLGMVYLPMGGGSNDFWGVDRPEHFSEYGTTVLALDYRTGVEQWHFQTVHHDTWDYDNGSQPILMDVTGDDGETTPAIIMPTKTAQLFMLDRRTGEPIAEVEERDVPQTGLDEDYTAPTQPFSVGMPQIGSADLTEADMWGATFVDQLYCRIQFRKLNYEGAFTPITPEPTLVFPGYYGGYNWGGASADGARDVLILNDIRIPQVVSLVAQDPEGEAAAGGVTHSAGRYPQVGSEYGTMHETFDSFLGVPCHMPPWGTLTAVDMQTRTILWQQPAGTIENAVLPNGIRSPLAMPVGMPTLGGPLTTASGLTFYSGTQDYYLRALDTETGEELWRGDLPVGTQSAPMTYTSPETGKQYVIVTAGGARQSPDKGDWVIAYALPE